MNYTDKDTNKEAKTGGLQKTLTKPSIIEESDAKHKCPTRKRTGVHKNVPIRNPD